MENRFDGDEADADNSHIGLYDTPEPDLNRIPWKSQSLTIRVPDLSRKLTSWIFHGCEQRFVAIASNNARTVGPVG